VPNAGYVIGIVTVTFNSAPVLEDFLNSLRLQSFRDFRLYAVDNASVDNSLEILNACFGIDFKIIANTDNRGVAEGNNQGILAAKEDRCKFVLLLNNDTVFGPELLGTLVNVATSECQQIVVPKIHFFSPPNKLWYAGGEFIPARGYTTAHVGEGETDLGQYDTDKVVSYSPTCCMLVAEQTFDTVGMMDERYFVYYDDTDFCLRAGRRGIKIWYTARTSLQHKIGSLTGGEGSPFSARMGARNKVYYLRKNFSRPIFFYFSAVYFLYLILRWLRGRDSWAKFRLKTRAFSEGLRL
jgi:GT2 family glycosyltransferase